MIRVKFRFGTANRKEMSWMSETSALMDTLRQEGVSPDLLRAVEEYRTAHPLAEALRGCRFRVADLCGRVREVPACCQIADDLCALLGEQEI